MYLYNNTLYELMTNNRFFLDRKSLLSSSRSSTGVAFVKFKNDTNDAVELIDEDVRLQRKTSFDNPTYGAMESMKKSQVSIGQNKYNVIYLVTYLSYKYNDIYIRKPIN